MARTIAGGSTRPDLLGPNQETFAARLASRTGLDLNVVRAWVHAEQPYDSPATGQMPYNDWLNIGWTGGDTRAQITYAPEWNDPTKAADATAEWLQGKWGSQYGYRAAGSIQAILAAAGEPPADQIRAIQQSGWAGSGYPQLPGDYAAVTGTEVIAGQAQNPGTRTRPGGGGGVFSGIEHDIGAGVHAVEGGIESLWGDVTGVVDFLKLLVWLVNPLTWLRAVEALFGFVLILAGIFVALGADKALQGTPAGAVAAAGETAAEA